MVTCSVADKATTNTPLSVDEDELFRKCESVIARHRTFFVEVGNALATIRDGRLYRATHTTFEAYVKARWDFGRAYAYRLIGAAETMPALSPTGDILPAAETQVRPLLQFPIEDRAQVWQDVLKKLPTDKHGNLMVTTAYVQYAVNDLKANSSDRPYTELRCARRKVGKERAARCRDQMSKTGRDSARPRKAANVQNQGGSADEESYDGLEDDVSTELDGPQEIDELDDLDRPAAEEGWGEELVDDVSTDLDRLDDLDTAVLNHMDDEEEDYDPVTDEDDELAIFALRCADEAIEALERIPADDPMRASAIDVVAEWIDEQRRPNPR